MKSATSRIWERTAWISARFHPERLRQLAIVARRSTPRALLQMDPERRHPILLAALAAAHTEIVDETVRVFDMMLSATDGNAR